MSLLNSIIRHLLFDQRNLSALHKNNEKKQAADQQNLLKKLFIRSNAYYFFKSVFADNSLPRGILYIVFSALMLLLILLSHQGTLIAEHLLFFFFCSFIAISIYEVTHEQRPKAKEIILVFGCILIQVFFVYFIHLIPQKLWFVEQIIPLILPYAFAPMITALLLGRNYSIFSSIICALFGCFVIPPEKVPYFFIMSLVVGMIVVLKTLKIQNRGTHLTAGLYSGLGVLCLGILFNYVNLTSLDFSNEQELLTITIQLLLTLFSSFFIAILIGGVLPLIESVFGFTTRLKWLELTDEEHPLLQELKQNASGTYAHSLMVGQLSFEAAKSIGANEIMCKACAYFHDIGKLYNPIFFIENQPQPTLASSKNEVEKNQKTQDAEALTNHSKKTSLAEVQQSETEELKKVEVFKNPHDDLSPKMSAIKIIEHVEKGVEIAEEHKLNPKIIQVIKEHHGDSVLIFFYRKAIEKQIEKKNEEDLETKVKKSDFSYGGPLPSFKESAIISLADAVESASRANSANKQLSQDDLRKLIDDIVKNRIIEGQLEQSNLTMKELQSVKESFLKILSSQFHQRITYPKLQTKINENEPD